MFAELDTGGGSNRNGAFHYPIGPAPRTAILVPWFRPSRETRAFEGWSDRVTQFAPAALAGTPQQLRDAAATGLKLTHAAIVLHRSAEPLLTAEEREQLWRAFHVPVFEQLISDDGQLLAAECEAHDGLHLTSPNLAAEAYSIESGPCACGLKTPRISRSQPVERVRAAAVYAR